MNNPEQVPQDQTPQDQAAAPAPQAEAPALDLSKSVSVTPPAPAVQLDLNKSVSVFPAPAPKTAVPEEHGWWYQNTVAPLADAAHRLKNAVLSGEGPGWAPYDANEALRSPLPLPEATDADATEWLKRTGYKTANPTFDIDHAKNEINIRRGKLWEEMKRAKNYEVGSGTGDRFISPDELMTKDEQRQHPVLTGLGRAAGSLSTQDNMMIMAGSGGLGTLGEAAQVVPKLGVLQNLVSATPRIVSAYFAGNVALGTAQQIPGLVQAKKDYDAAIAAGDQTKADDILWNAKEQSTEIAAGAYMAYAAAYHAKTGHPEPVAAAIASGVRDTTQYAAEQAVQAIRNVPDVANATMNATKAATGKVTDTLGLAIGRTNDFDTAIKRASKISPKQSTAHAEKIADVSEDLQAIANQNPDVSGPKEFADAIRKNNQAEEAKMQQTAGATKDSQEPVVPGAENRLRARLDKFFDDNKGTFSQADVDKAKQDILDHFLQHDEVGRDDKNNPVYSTRVPNLFESENVRQGLNALTAPQFNTNAQPTTSAFKAGAMEAANATREMIDESYHGRGVEGVKEFRSKEAKLIDVAKALEGAQDRADKMGEGGVFRSMMKKIGVPSSVIAIALGHPVSGAALGAAVLGDQISQNLTNPNVNVDRALELAARNPKAQATSVAENPNTSSPAAAAPPPPVNHKLYSALSSHYGKIIGAVPFGDLEGRFLGDIQANQEKGIPPTPEQQQLLSKINDVKADERVKAEEQQKADVEQAQADAEKETADRQKAAEKAQAEQQKAIEKAQDEAEKKKQEQLDLGMPLSVGPPFDVADSELHVPKEIADLGYTPEQIRHHEAGHLVMVHDAGFSPQDVISHLHENAEGNSAAARWNADEFRDEDAGGLDVEKIKAKLPEILSMIFGGAVTEELIHGKPVHSNPGAEGDFKLAKQLLDLVNVPAVERGAIMKTAELKAREVLTKPGVIDTIKKYTDNRKAGIGDDTHIDPETVGAMTQEIKNLGETNANDNQTAGKDGGLGKEGKPGGKSQVPGKAETAARPARKTGEGVRSTEGRAEPELTHEEGDKFNTVNLNSGGKSIGKLKYSLRGDTASIDAVQAEKGKGNGQKMLAEAEKLAQEKGATKMVAGVNNSVSMDAAKMLDRAGYQKSEGTIPGSPVYSKELSLPLKPDSSSAPSEAKKIVEAEGLKYKGELVKGSNVHMFEHPDHPGKTAALEGPLTSQLVRDKMRSKLKEFGVETPAEVDHTKGHQGEQ